MSNRSTAKSIPISRATARAWAAVNAILVSWVIIVPTSFCA